MWIQKLRKHAYLWIALTFSLNLAFASTTSELNLPEANSILKKRVDFWIQIYTKYTIHQGLIHDAKYLDLVYEVIPLRKDPKTRRGPVSVSESKKKWRNLLLSVHRKQAHPEMMNPEEKALFLKFKDVDEPNKFLNAAHRKRLRFQLGQKENFLSGLIQSGQYLPRMEEVFKEEREKEGMPKEMPIELTRLPFVESSFNVQARSKVGASGIWQFMGSTAQLFIQVNDAVDERNDPVMATKAAAHLLGLNYSSLRSWPLAVTAYNHGRKGMMRAVRRIGTEDLSELFVSYHNRSFGFASSNFFAELLAAIEIEKNYKRYFGEVERLKPIPYIEVKLPDSVLFSTLVKYLKLNQKTLAALNPALTDAVIRGELWIPAGYSFRIPDSSEGLNQKSLVEAFWEKYHQIPRSEKQQGQPITKYGTSERLVKY